MKCYYHNDLDGKCSAAIVFQSVGIKPQDKRHEYEFIEVDYKDEIDITKIKPHEQVWIVDFSFIPELMEKVLKITRDITWIDHHKTAMEYQYSIKLAGVRDINFSGCELAWKYVHPGLQVPQIVEMLGRYDVWDFSKYGEDLNRLQAGLKLHNTSPDNYEWVLWFDGGLSTIVDLLNEGSIALRYRENYYTDLIKNLAFFVEFEGYKLVVCNAGLANSQLFDSIQDDFDIMAPFSFDGKKWKISLYTKKDIDVSEIAKKHGGGGHKQAAGFVCSELPSWLLKAT